MITQEVNISKEELIRKRVDDNLNLIYAPTRKFYNSNEMIKVKYDFNELLSVSTIALHKASSKFDESKGCKFSTYAVTIIKYSLMEFTRKDKWYYDRKTVDGVEKFVVVDRITTSHIIKDNRESCGSNKSITLENSLIDEDNNYEKSDNEILVDELLNTCTDRERNIIEDYFYKELTQKQLSDKYKTSQSHISLVIKRNLARFKGILGGKVEC